MKLVHWPLMGGLLHLVQRGGDWAKNDKIPFKMADGRHIKKCSKCYNLATSGAIWTKLGWSHPVISQTWPPLCGCHGNCRCLATAHWTFSSYGRLVAERVIQFWWNLVQSRMAITWPNMTAAILENVENAITRLPINQYERNLGGRMPSSSWHVHHNAVAIVTAVA